ncbi:MAG: GNAT family N-acetyltransferase [Armatimonadetes bacterium]|nr:GNAT family N-acetyltransferase [Armatimonadota bacterium]
MLEMEPRQENVSEEERQEATPALELIEVTTMEGLERLRPEWAGLWKRSPTATPFQSPEWLIPWWRHIGEGDLWTLALREKGRLVGLLPLYIYTQEWNGSRDVFPLGIATTDYLDALFLPGYEDAGMAAAFAHLDANRDRWDLCDFSDLRESSPLLSAPAPSGWSDEVEHGEPCPVLTLPETEEGLSGCVPGHLLHNLRYYTRRAEREGEVTFEAANADTVEDLFDALLRLHRARWITKGEEGVLSSEAVQRTHREALPGLLALGVLRLYAMRIGGRIVAVFYGFTDTHHPMRRSYYYLSGFEPELSHLSLGTLVIGHAVREAIRDGAAEFDFLRGHESYKYLWGAQDRWNRHRRLWHG